MRLLLSGKPTVEQALDESGAVRSRDVRPERGAISVIYEPSVVRDATMSKSSIATIFLSSVASSEST